MPADQISTDYVYDNGQSSHTWKLICATAGSMPGASVPEGGGLQADPTNMVIRVCGFAVLQGTNFLKP